VVHDCGLCTMHDPERFFSHRRDGGVTGRQAGVAWRS
jgi:polyphenol oxidase